MRAWGTVQIVFRPFPGEIVTAKLLKCNSEGLKVTHRLRSTLYVKQMPEMAHVILRLLWLHVILGQIHFESMQTANDRWRLRPNLRSRILFSAFEWLGLANRVRRRDSASIGLECLVGVDVFL